MIKQKFTVRLGESRRYHDLCGYMRRLEYHDLLQLFELLVRNELTGRSSWVMRGVSVPYRPYSCSDEIGCSFGCSFASLSDISISSVSESIHSRVPIWHLIACATDFYET